MSIFKLALFFAGLLSCNVYAVRTYKGSAVFNRTKGVKKHRQQKVLVATVVEQNKDVSVSKKPLPLDLQVACIQYNEHIQALKMLKRKLSKKQKQYYAATCKFGVGKYIDDAGIKNKQVTIGTAGEQADLDLIKYDIQKKRIR